MRNLRSKPNGSLFQVYSKASKKASVNWPSSGVLVHLTLQKTIAIFLKYSIQKSSLVDELQLSQMPKQDLSLVPKKDFSLCLKQGLFSVP